MSVATLLSAILILAIFPFSSANCICVKDYLCNYQFRKPLNGTSNSSEPVCLEKEICCYPKESVGEYVIPAAPKPLVIVGRNETASGSGTWTRLNPGTKTEEPNGSVNNNGTASRIDAGSPDFTTLSTDKPTSTAAPLKTSGGKKDSKDHQWSWNKYKRPYGMKGWQRESEKINGSEETSEHSLYPWRCGRGQSFISDSDDLAKGSTALNKFPWAIAIFKEKKVICSGSLINPFVVLTAAHCIRSEAADKPELRLRGGGSGEGRQERSPSRLVLHPDCDWKTRHNDLALVFLDQPFTLTHSLAPVCFGDHNYDPQRCLFTGWRSLGSKSNYTEVLRVLTQPIMDKEECVNKLRLTELGEKFKLHKGDICAKGIPDQQPCSGSGGGALVCRSLWGDSLTQVGLLSWSVKCGTETPAVYASLGHHSDWLWSQIGQHARLNDQPNH